MPLIDLRTNLKSLKYGHDSPGGGDSAQPYIKVDINKVDSGFNEFRLTRFDDGLIRGGIIGATNAAVVDTLRIGKFFTDLPRGPLFLVKQAGLQLSNPRLEVPKNPINIVQGGTDNLLSATTGGLLAPTRIYNLGINTIAQIPVNAFGGHFNRHGLLPVQDKDSKYEAVVKANNNLSQASQIAGIANTFLTGIPTPQATTEFISSANRLFNLTKELGIYGKRGKTPMGYFNNVAVSTGGGQARATFTNNSNQTNLQGVTVLSNTRKPEIEVGENIPSLSYLGGPNSVYGIGNTDIKRSIITNFNPNKELFRDTTIRTVDNLTRIEDQNIANDQYLAASATGISRIDPRLYPYVDVNDPNYDPISIRDNTVIEYTDVQPRLRKYYELTDALNKISSRSELYNIIDTDKLYSSNFTSSNYSVQIRNVSTTEGSITRLKNDITYFNGIVDDKFNFQRVTLKGFNSWNAVAREQRIGDFGKAETQILNVSGSNIVKTKKIVGRADSINLTPLFEREKYWSGDGGSLKSDWVAINGVNYNTRDLAKFRIQAINTDSPDLGNFMVFRALLTNLTDNVDADWNDVNYVGRGNPFYIYGGSTRKVSIGFKVAALSAEEMAPMYSKLNYLMSTLMPDYGAGNVMRGSLHRMTIGNYFDAQLGILTSLSYTIPNDSPWEIALDEPEGGIRQLILPHILEVSLGFTPIGAETRRINKIESKDESTTFIAQNNTGTDANKIQYYDDFIN
jgi:hypothetical protein